jgi:hypothetical protein
VAVGVALVLTHRAWGGRPPAGDDVMALVIRAHRGVGLAGRGRYVGWAPDFLLGFEPFLFYGPGFAWFVGLLRVLTLGTLSVTGAVKVVGIVSFAALGPAVAFLARGLGLDRRSSGVAAILALGVNNVFGVGLAATYTIGLVPHELGAVLFCVALGSMLRSVRQPERRWVVIGGVSAAGLLVTHPLSAVVLVIFGALTLPMLRLTERFSTAGLGRLARIGGLALALGAFWIVPCVAHFALRGPVPTWGSPPLAQRLRDIGAGRILFSRWIALAVLVGLPFGVVRVWQGRRWAAALLATPIGFLVIAHLLAAHLPHFELSPQLTNRALGYVGLVALFPLATLMAWGTGWPGRSVLPRRGALVAADVAAAGLAVLLVVGLGGVRDLADQMPKPAPELADAAVALRRLVPPSARFATERDFPGEITRLGPSHPDFWLAARSGRNTLNVFGLELSASPGVGGVPEAIGRVSAAESAHALARLGVTHVVTVSDAGRRLLRGSPRFRTVWNERSLAIFEVVSDAGQPSPASMVVGVDTGLRSARLVSAQPSHLTIEVDAAAAGTVSLAVARSPKWHLRVDGRPVALQHSADGLLEAVVPAGRSSLRLDFRPDGWDAAGQAVSGLTVLALLAWLVVRRRSEGGDEDQSSSRMSSSFSRTA